MHTRALVRARWLLTLPTSACEATRHRSASSNARPQSWERPSQKPDSRELSSAQCAAHDPFLPEPELEVVERTVEVRRATGDGPAPDIQVRRYPGTCHGFVVRGGAAKSTLVEAAKRQV